MTVSGQVSRPPLGRSSWPLTHAYRKQQAIEDSIRGWQALGEAAPPRKEHRAALMTLTVRHDAGQSLAELLPAVLRAFTLMMNSHFVRGLRKQDAYFGYVRAVEITWNAQSGWHPHVHALVFTSDMAAFERAWRTRTDRRGKKYGLKIAWAEAVQKASADTKASRPIRAMPSAQDMRSAELEDAGRLAGYVTKDGVRWSIAAEMTRQDVKTGRQRSLAPLQLLLAAGDGDRRKRDLWREYVRATKGVQRVSFSYHDFAARVTVADHLTRELERHEARLGDVWGDSPYAVANREAREAQAAELRGLSVEQRRALDARERQSEPQLVQVASFARSEELSGKEGRITLAQMNGNPRLLLGLLDAIEANAITPSREAAAAYIEEQGLPVEVAGSRRSGRRAVDSAWQTYRVRKADFEARLSALNLDEDREEFYLDRFEAAHRPESMRTGLRWQMVKKRSSR